MRLGHALLAGVLASAGCSDGVGMPIREALENEDGSVGEGMRFDGGAVTRPTCDDVAQWPRDFEESERQLRDMLNALRMSGFPCGGRRFPALPALQPAPELQCSARLHAVDMATHMFVSRSGSDGSNPGARMEAAGFEAAAFRELNESNDVSAREALDDLFQNSDDTCWAIAEQEFTHIGVGRHDGYWTVDLAARESTGGSGP